MFCLLLIVSHHTLHQLVPPYCSPSTVFTRSSWGSPASRSHTRSEALHSTHTSFSLCAPCPIRHYLGRRHHGSAVERRDICWHVQGGKERQTDAGERVCLQQPSLRRARASILAVLSCLSSCCTSSFVAPQIRFCDASTDAHAEVLEALGAVQITPFMASGHRVEIKPDQSFECVRVLLFHSLTLQLCSFGCLLLRSLTASRCSKPNVVHTHTDT